MNDLCHCRISWCVLGDHEGEHQGDISMMGNGCFKRRYAPSDATNKDVIVYHEYPLSDSMHAALVVPQGAFDHFVLPQAKPPSVIFLLLRKIATNISHLIP